MPVVMMESFRQGLGVIIGGNASTGTTVWSRAASRTGWGIRQTNGATLDNSINDAHIEIRPPTPFAGNDFSIAFAVWHPPAQARSLYLRVQPTGGDNVFLNWNARTGAAITLSGGSVVGSFSPGVTHDTTSTTAGWHWYNLVGRMNLATGGFYRFYRDGTLVHSIEGDTLASGNSAGRFNAAFIVTSPHTTPSGCIISDIILRDDSNIIPESRVDGLLPISNASAEWTPSEGENWDCVNDETTISTTDFVSSSTVGATDLYNFEPLPFSPNTIHGVMLSARASKSDAGERTMATVLNGTESAAVDPSTGGYTFRQMANTNPSGGAAWTKAAVDAIQAGVRLKT